MISLTSIFLLFCGFTICYAFYKDVNNKVWNILVDSFQSKPIAGDDNGQVIVQVIYFKIVGDSEFDHFNSMNICRGDEGVLMYPTINHYLLKPIFIPWSEMEKIKDASGLFDGKDEYKISNLDLILKF